jgi:PAS domain S-box-containing protein
MMMMRDEDKTRDRLIEELRASSSRIGELEAAEERYRTIVSSMSDMVMLLDAEDCFVEVHSRPGSALLVSPEGVRGKRHLDLMPPHLIALYEQAAPQVRRSGRPQSYEYPLQIAGEPMWFTATLNLHEDGESIVAGIRDITDLRRAEEASRRSEDRFKELAEMLPEAIFETDGEATLTYANRRGFQLFGYTAEDLTLGINGIDLIIPEQRDRARANLALRLSGEQDSAVEYQALRRDGSTFPMLFHMTRILKDGDLVGFRGVAVDITVRAQNEAALKASEVSLRQSEQRLQAVFDSTADYLTLLDWEHRIQMINRIEQGLQREELLGTPLYTLVAPDDQARVREHLDRVVQRAERQQYNTSYDRPDGSTRHYSSIAAPVIVSGQVTGSVVSSRNVTEQIRLEREKDQLEAQYHQAQKMEAIGRLAGGIAHDFNNMLSVIEGNAELALADLTAGDPLAESMEAICQATERAADLTRQLLTFSRKQVIAPKVVNLSRLIEGLHPMLVRLIGEDIILRTLPQERIGRVRADPGQIEQIVLNLAVNARDAMPAGGELIIETADEDPNTTPGPHVVLTVSDTGCGMSSEIIEKIFEPFFTTKEIGHGTGLGLATVFGIVEQHGGRLEVHSAPGEGSSFKIYLPRVFEKADTLAHPEKAAPLGGRETVLLVEDEEMVRSLTLKLLRRLGYKVLSAASGGDALVLEERHEGAIDLLFTDVIMPQMNGHDLAERLVKLRPGLKVLYSSGYTQDLIAHHGVLDEEVQFLAKPYSLDSLAAKVRKALDRA